jgi:hypothetical protein
MDLYEAVEELAQHLLDLAWVLAEEDDENYTKAIEDLLQGLVEEISRKVQPGFELRRKALFEP